MRLLNILSLILYISIIVLGIYGGYLIGWMTDDYAPTIFSVGIFLGLMWSAKILDEEYSK
jgi:hypothetical protein